MKKKQKDKCIQVNTIIYVPIQHFIFYSRGFFEIHIKETILSSYNWDLHKQAYHIDFIVAFLPLGCVLC